MVKNKNSFFGKIQQKAEELKSEVPPLLKSKKDSAKSQSHPKPQSTTQVRPSSQLLQGPTMEQLIEASLVDGALSEQEKQTLYKKAQASGWNLDEFNIMLDARLAKAKQERMEKVISSQPKSKKYGDVRKCPNCGALVEALTHSCKECGYEFADVEGNYSGKLMDRISQIQENFNKRNEEIRKYNSEVSRRNAERGLLKRKESFVSEQDRETMYEDIRMAISTFQIPNTRAELFDFVMFLKPKIKKIKKDKIFYFEDEFGEVYEQKYNECIERIRSLFSTDPIFAKILYEADAKTRRKILTNQWTWIGLVVLLIALIVLFFILKPKPIQKNLERSSAAIEKAIKEGDTHKATEIFLAFEGSRNNHVADLRTREAEPLIDACLEADNFNDAYRIGKHLRCKFGGIVGWDYPEIASKLYKYCISHDDFETAKNICQTRTPEYLGTYIKDVVVHLCKKSKKSEAQTFLNENIYLVTTDGGYRDKMATCERKESKLSAVEQDRSCVKKQVQDIIDSY